jgi:hypothetical protein
MRESRSYGSVRGAFSNERPYRELIAVHVLSADKDDRNGLNGDDKNPGHGNRLSACEPLAPRVDFV